VFSASSSVGVLSRVYIGKGWHDNTGDNDSRQPHHRPIYIYMSVSNALVLALANLGGVTKNRINSICVASPKVAKASTIRVAVAGIIALTFANGNTALLWNEW